jgi:betaine-aldehyde dehydrogenase
MCTAEGLPDGAVNVVTGLGPDAGGPLSSHPGIDKISFTGFVHTARRIMTAAALGPRAVSLELGGKSPLIVFDDADMPSAVDWIITGFLWGSGQVCSATSRVFVHKSIREKLIKLLLEKVTCVRLGDSLAPDMLAHSESGKPTMGPVVSKGQYDKIWQYIDDAKAAGLTPAYGGDRSLVSSLGKGFFIPPTIFLDVPTTRYRPN